MPVRTRGQKRGTHGIPNGQLSSKHLNGTSRAQSDLDVTPPSCGCLFAKCLDDEQVPVFVRRKYVAHGYRFHYTFFECLRSVFQVHNETSDIYTHGLPSFYFLYCFFDVLSHPERYLSWEDQVSIALVPLASFFTFGWSSLSHTFHCMSEKVSRFMFKMDWFFIATHVTVAHLVVGRILFLKYPEPFRIYASLIGLCTAVSWGSNLAPWFHTPAFKALRVIWQATAFVVGGLIQFHWIYFYEGITEYSMILLKFLWGTYAILLSAVTIYATDFPEKYFPYNAVTTYLMYSHQIFHVLSASSMLNFFLGLEHFYQVYHRGV